MERSNPGESRFDSQGDALLSKSARAIMSRVAGAPISWGVCEVPGWGLQLPVERVLREMREVGLDATELGSVGYLPSDPDELRGTLHDHRLRLVGGFNALALADPTRVDDSLEQAERSARVLGAAGASTFVTCIVSDPADWQRPELSPSGWSHAFSMLDRVGEICASYGLTQVFHPHVDSHVETAEEMQRVLDGSGVAWVLETGHMLIGGYNPLQFALDHGDRVRLVHLKDLRSSIAARLNAEELSLMEAVQAGLFVPLGQGDVPIAAVVETLESQGYEGWYVIEQDAAISSAEPAPGDGPIRDVEDSVAFLRLLDARLEAS